MRTPTRCSSGSSRRWSAPEASRVTHGRTRTILEVIVGRQRASRLGWPIGHNPFGQLAILRTVLNQQASVTRTAPRVTLATCPSTHAEETLTRDPDRAGDAL